MPVARCEQILGVRLEQLHCIELPGTQSRHVGRHRPISYPPDRIRIAAIASDVVLQTQPRGRHLRD
jgi:hypothetical protein